MCRVPQLTTVESELTTASRALEEQKQDIEMSIRRRASIFDERFRTPWSSRRPRTAWDDAEEYKTGDRLDPHLNQTPSLLARQPLEEVDEGDEKMVEPCTPKITAAERHDSSEECVPEALRSIAEAAHKELSDLECQLASTKLELTETKAALDREVKQR